MALSSLHQAFSLVPPQHSTRNAPASTIRPSLPLLAPRRRLPHARCPTAVTCSSPSPSPDDPPPLKPPTSKGMTPAGSFGSRRLINIPVLSEEELERGLCSTQLDEDEQQETCTYFVAETLLPTTSGFFRVRAYRHTVGSPEGQQQTTEPLAIIHGSVEDMEKVPVRVHDACFTSEVLGSMKCDCAEQLNRALEHIQQCEYGIVVYLQQEGRGVGLANKIAAYAMQETGLDTVDANRALGFADDSREYTAVAHMLEELGIKSIRLMTNNPRKIERLSSLGVEIADRIPVIIDSNEFSRGYLEAKEQRMDHQLDGAWCYVDHQGD